MNKILEEKLQRLNNDEYLVQALRSLLEERIEKEKPKLSGTDDDSVIGQKYRAYEHAKTILEGYFTDIDSYKEGSKDTKKFNKER